MYIFFLIPFLLIVSFGIYQDVFAQQLDSYRGENYYDEQINSTTHVWTGGLEPYVESGFLDAKGRPIFLHYVLNEDANSITVQNGAASFVFDKLTCSAKIYKGGIIDDSNSFILGSDSYVPKSSVDGSGTWSIVTSVNNAPCVTEVIETADSISISGTKTAAAGIFKITYLKEKGSPLKTILEATNLTALTDRRFGVTQTQSIPQIITFGGVERDLANFVGQTFDRTWLENNQANLLEFSQGLKFDTIDAWNHLESVSVNSVSNGVASISFNYLRNTPILLPNETLVIDPTYSSNNPTEDGYVISTSVSGAACSGTGNTIQNALALVAIYSENSGVSGPCDVMYFQWDISSIIDSALITDSDFTFDVATVTNAANCDYIGMSVKPTTGTADTIYDNIMTGGTVLVNNDATCTTTGDNKNLDLTSTGDTYIDTQLASDWAAIGVKFDKNPSARTATAANQIDFEPEEDAGATPKPTLTVVYINGPDPVTDLTYTNLEQTSVDLLWTQPNLNGQILINYVVNYTTPFGTPNTFLGNTTSTYLNVTGLNDETPYSFRVGVQSNTTFVPYGNILNLTTTGFLTIGNLSNPDVTNTDDFQIFFERDDINATALFLNVTYSDTYDLSCDFKYKLARTNQTYSNLANVTVPPDQVESSFLLVNATGDIINVRCYDEITGDESKYVITLTDFEFLEQVRNLRNGTYGTAFEFGAIDGVILVVLILSMIGFNRTNPAVGVIFLVITVGALSILGIITYPIIMYPALALLVLWAVITTRKDD